MRRGFTLIELLVVIAIIALLIGILLPSLGAARKTAWAMVETTNMRQLAVAASLYNEDHQGWYNPIQDTIDTRVFGTVNTPFGPQTGVISGGLQETTWRFHLWEYYSKAAEVIDSPAERDDVYSDGLAQSDIDAARRVGDNITAAPGLQHLGMPGVGELYNRGPVGANGWHYWRYGNRRRDPDRREGTTPFGRPGRGLGQLYDNERLARAGEVQFPTLLVLFGGGTDHPVYPEDTWWIYKFAPAVQVRLPGPGRFEQHLSQGSEGWALTYQGKGAYSFADGSARVIDPRDITCNFDVCHWSVLIDAHRGFQP